MYKDLRVVCAAILAAVLLFVSVLCVSNDAALAEETVVETTTVAEQTTVVTETTATTTEKTTTSTTKTTTQKPTTTKTTTTTTKQTTRYSNSDDVDLLARVIYCEAGGCSYRNRQLVGAVVLNRVSSSSYPNTIKGVVYQSGQYSCTGKLYNVTPDSETRQIAADLIANGAGSVCPSNVVYQSQYRQGSGVYEAIASPYGTTTYFCYA